MSTEEGNRKCLYFDVRLSADTPNSEASCFCLIPFSSIERDMSSPIVGLSIGKCSFSYVSTISDTISSSMEAGSDRGVSSVTIGSNSSILLRAYSYWFLVISIS